MVDRYSGRWAHESKVGYVKYSKFLRKQILKDRMLVRDKNIPVKGAHWHFYKSVFCASRKQGVAAKTKNKEQRTKNKEESRIVNAYTSCHYEAGDKLIGSFTGGYMN